LLTRTPLFVFGRTLLGVVAAPTLVGLAAIIAVRILLTIALTLFIAVARAINFRTLMFRTFMTLIGVVAAPFLVAPTTLLVIGILLTIQAAFFLTHTTAGTEVFLTIFGVLLTPLLPTALTLFVIGVGFAVSTALFFASAATRPGPASRPFLTLRPVGTIGAMCFPSRLTLLLVSRIGTVGLALFLTAATTWPLNSRRFKTLGLGVGAAGLMMIGLTAIDLTLSHRSTITQLRNGKCQSRKFFGGLITANQTSLVSKFKTGLAVSRLVAINFAGLDRSAITQFRNWEG
jgi:hypothetical protein